MATKVNGLLEDFIREKDPRTTIVHILSLLSLITGCFNGFFRHTENFLVSAIISGFGTVSSAFAVGLWAVGIWNRKPTVLSNLITGFTMLLDMMITGYEIYTLLFVTKTLDRGGKFVDSFSPMKKLSTLSFIFATFTAISVFKFKGKTTDLHLSRETYREVFAFLGVLLIIVLFCYIAAGTIRNDTEDLDNFYPTFLSYPTDNRDSLAVAANGTAGPKQSFFIFTTFLFRVAEIVTNPETGEREIAHTSETRAVCFRLICALFQVVYPVTLLFLASMDFVRHKAVSKELFEFAFVLLSMMGSFVGKIYNMATVLHWSIRNEDVHRIRRAKIAIAWMVENDDRSGLILPEAVMDWVDTWQNRNEGIDEIRKGSQQYQKEGNDKMLKGSHQDQKEGIREMQKRSKRRGNQQYPEEGIDEMRRGNDQYPEVEGQEKV